MAQEAKEEAEIAHQAQVALDTTSLFYAHRRGEAQNVVLENELIKLTFNTRGGTVQKVELKEYKNQQGGPVTLFDEKDARMQFMLGGKTENINSGDLFFTPINVSDTTLTMRLQASTGGDTGFRLQVVAPFLHDRLYHPSQRFGQYLRSVYENSGHRME